MPKNIERKLKFSDMPEHRQYIYKEELNKLIENIILLVEYGDGTTVTKEHLKLAYEFATNRKLITL